MRQQQQATRDTVNLKDIADRLGTRAGTAQFGVMAGIDHLFRRFEELAEGDKPALAEIQKIKKEMIVEPLMHHVNMIRAQQRFLHIAHRQQRQQQQQQREKESQDK
jgi:hypothetical protein